MRHLVLAFVAMSLTVATSAASFAGGQVLYLDAGSWKCDNVRYAVCFYGNGDGVWVSMEAVENDIYRVVAPEGKWHHVVFCQMKDSDKDNVWNNRLKQTEIVGFEEAKDVFVVAGSAGGDKYAGVWAAGISGGRENVRQTSLEVYTVGATIVANRPMKIYSITGADMTVENGQLAKGVYIVRTDIGARKVMVK